MIGRISPCASRWFSLLVSGILFLGSLFSYNIILLSDSSKFQLVDSFPWIDFFGAEIRFEVGLDGISAPLFLLSAFLSVLVTAGSFKLISANERQYYALILLFEGAILGVFASLNLMLFLVFWELAILPMFLFIGIWGGPNRKSAAIKFLLFTTLGSLLMLVAFVTVFLSSGASTFDLQTLVASRLPLELQFLPAVLAFVGFAIKLPLIPFHTWLPDAHVEAPSPISVLLAGLMLKMGGYGIIRIVIGIFREFAMAYGVLFIVLGTASVLFAALTAMVQDDLKRMVALTSINHMGFVAIGAFSLSAIGISGAVLQMFCHGCAIGLLFLLTGVIQEGAGSRSIRNLRGLATGMPTVSLLLVVGFLASMGIPGFGNFIAELSVIQAAIGVQWVFGVVVAGPAITAAYFLWTMRRVFRQTAGVLAMKSASRWEIVTLALFIVPIVLLGAYPGLMMTMIYPAASIMSGMGGL
jgi:proton-translocating NADH-quinone oxidoreductase chain M